MRISDLSRQAGISIATIKFYLREGLLPPGIPTGRNQAVYGEVHLRRIRLIRAFTTIGGLDLSLVSTLLQAIEKPDTQLNDLYTIVHNAGCDDQPTTADTPSVAAARADVDGFIDDIGWHVDPDSPARHRLSLALAALTRLGCESGIDLLTPYADACTALAQQETDLIPDEDTPNERAAAIVRTVLFEVCLAAVRRMAQQHHVQMRRQRDGRGPAPARSALAE
jgi:DNA-binding transcriptional MerR regulator